MRARLLLIICLLPFFTACELDSFLFNEKKIDQYKLPGNTIPDSLLEQVTFKSENNTLYGYWVQAENPFLDIAILYCHGNKHHIDEYWDRVMMLHDLGVNVFIFDFRGYGMSEGTPSEAGMYKDGEAALDFILTNYGVQPESLCLYGYSLGNVTSIYLAAEVIDPLCLIAESPFASANSLTQSGIGLDLPALWLTEGKFDNAEKIHKIKTPFLLLHGEEDDFVRYRDNGKVVFDNAPEPKSLQLVSGANHTDIPETMGINHYITAIYNWIHFSTDI